MGLLGYILHAEPLNFTPSVVQVHVYNNTTRINNISFNSRCVKYVIQFYSGGATPGFRNNS